MGPPFAASGTPSLVDPHFEPRLTVRSCDDMALGDSRVGLGQLGGGVNAWPAPIP